MYAAGKSLLTVLIAIATFAAFLAIVRAQVITLTVSTLNPVSARQGTDESVTIGGAGFEEPVTVTFGTGGESEIQLVGSVVSSSELTIQIPVSMPIGIYTVCIQTRCLVPRFEVLAPATISSVEPITIYNWAPNTIAIYGTDLISAQYATLASPSGTLTFPASYRSSDDIATALIPTSVSTGTYVVGILLNDGSAASGAANLDVVFALGTIVSSTEPTAVSAWGRQTVTVAGSDWPSSTFGCSFDHGSSTCEILSLGEQGLNLLLKFIDRLDGPRSLQLSLPDGTTRAVPVGLVPPVAPWNVGSWVWYLGIVLVTQVGAYLAYRRGDQALQESVVNQTAPSPANTVALILYAILYAAGFWLVLGIVYRNFTNDPWLLFAAACLVSASCAVALLFVLIDRRVSPAETLRVSVPAAMVYAIVALLLPFLAGRLSTVPLLLVANPILLLQVLWFLAGAAAAVGALAYRRTLLEKERAKGPSDAQLTLAIEDILYQTGQVSAADFPGLPLDRVADAINNYRASRLKEQGLEYNNITGVLSFSRRDDIRAVSEGFSDLRLASSTSGQPQAVAASSGKVLGTILSSFGFVPGPPYYLVNAPTVFQIQSAEPVDLKSILPSPFPLLLYRPPNKMVQSEMQELQLLLNEFDVPSRFAILVVPNNADATRETIQHNLGGVARENVVVFSERDCLDVLASSQELPDAIMSAVGRQVDLAIFSPYKTEGPTSSDMFYGRRKELGTVLEKINDSSIAILGARRMGKTSMLQAAQRLLEERGKALFYLDCYHIGNYETFLGEMATQWQLSAPVDLAEYPTIDHFSKFVVDMKTINPERQIVFQLDEIDRLLAHDARKENGEALFRRFRALAQLRHCEFIFSGERAILERLHDSRSAFFNFPSKIQLELLSREDAYALVKAPMRRISVTLAEEAAILAYIYEQTTGHPNLIQYVCESLLTRLSVFKTRVLRLDSVKEFCEGQDYLDKCQQTYLSQSDGLEKAIVVAVADHGSLDQQGIYTYLRRCGYDVRIAEIARSLRYLLLCQALQDSEKVYTLKANRLRDSFAAYPYSQWLEDYRLEWLEKAG